MKNTKLVPKNTLQIDLDGTMLLCSILCPLETHDEDLTFTYKDNDEVGTPCCMLDGNVCEHFISVTLSNGFQVECDAMKKKSEFITFDYLGVADKVHRKDANNYLRSKGVLIDKGIPDNVDKVKIIVTPNKLEYISEEDENV